MCVIENLLNMPVQLLRLYNINLQIPLPTAVHTLGKEIPSLLPLMMLPALDQKLPSFHVLIPQVITVYIARMLVLSVFHVSVLVMNYIN